MDIFYINILICTITLHNFFLKSFNYLIYFSIDAECKVIKPIGLSNGAIPDTAINATSQRLNYESRVRLEL